MSLGLVSPLSSPHVRGRDPLVQRTRELDRLSRGLRGAQDDRGTVVIVEAPPGTGRSRLLDAAADIAGQQRMRIIRAAGIESERELSHGLLRRLTAVFSPDVAGAATSSDPVVEAVWARLVATARSDAERGTRATAMIIDDLQWADASSLRALSYMARRLDGVRIALVVALRSGEPVVDPAAVAQLRRVAGPRLVTPTDLTDVAVSALVRRRFSEAEDGFCIACARASSGNPYLLTHLIEELWCNGTRAAAANGALVAATVPARVAAMVAERLRRLDQAERRVAESLSILGDDAPIDRVARLAGLDPARVLGAAEPLSEAGMLGPAVPLAFTAPMLATAVRATLTPFARARDHLDAARLLIEDHAESTAITHHLLLAPGTGNPEAIRLLREVAASAMADGNPHKAVPLLARALEERPTVPARAQLLAELGRAQFATDATDAPATLARAREMAADAGERGRLALAHGVALYRHGAYAKAAAALLDGAKELGDRDPATGRDLSAAFVAAASLVTGLETQATELRERIFGALSGEPRPLERMALAHTLGRDAVRGAPSRQLRQIARAAWAEGGLTEAVSGMELGVVTLCTGLVFADELEWAIEIADTVTAAPAGTWATSTSALVRCARAWARYLRGEVAEADLEATAALQSSPHDRRVLTAARLLLAQCAAEQGRSQTAEEILAQLGDGVGAHPVVRARFLLAHAYLALAQHRPGDALAHALEAGEVTSAYLPDVSPGAVPWRSTAASAHLALGNPDRARPLIQDELARARRIGVTRSIIRNLRLLGLALGARGTRRLAEAVEAGAGRPPRLEYARALVDHGAALRRANQRAAAREPLREGLDLSHRGGVNGLAARAETELSATGARPRRAATTGIDALTASQRRVADLAAEGLTTRQIGEALFITPKTVEFHLRQTYLKLDVGTRQALAEVMQAAA